MASWTRVFIIVLAALLAAALAVGTLAAQEVNLAKRLLQAVEGLQMPGSETTV